MTFRHLFLYNGFTPVFFHLFVILSIVLPFFKRSIIVETSTQKALYRSNILGEPNTIFFDKPSFSIERDRQIGTIIIKTIHGTFNTKITEDHEKIKGKVFLLTKNANNKDPKKALS